MENKNINKLLRLVVLLLCSYMTAPLFAQTSYKRVNGKTYVYEKSSIHNKYNRTASENVETEGFEVKNYLMVAETVKQLFSAERIKELQNEMVAIMFDCDVDGKIKAVSFLFGNSPFLTPSEVEQLESIFLQKSFEINTKLEKGKIIGFTIPCFFSRIQK